MEGLKQQLWECPDETAAETEMGDLLYGLVRMLKPLLVVETGTYLGHSSKFLYRAIMENGRGHFVTCDTNPQATFEGFYAGIDYRHCSSLVLPELSKADFIFSDSDYKFRAAEIGRAKKGAVIVVHDTRISYDSALPPLEGFVRDMGGICFESYRGFGILVKGETP